MASNQVDEFDSNFQVCVRLEFGVLERNITGYLSTQDQLAMGKYIKYKLEHYLPVLSETFINTFVHDIIEAIVIGIP